MGTAYLQAQFKQDGQHFVLEEIGVYSEEYLTTMTGQRYVLLDKISAADYEKASTLMWARVNLLKKYEWLRKLFPDEHAGLGHRRRVSRA